MWMIAATSVQADTTWDNLSSFTNYQADGSTKFVATTGINFTSGDRDEQYLEASIDITSCDENGIKLRNVLSLGNKIDKWGTEDASYINLHFYYTPQTLVDAGCDDGHNHKIDQRLRISYVTKAQENSFNIAFMGSVLNIKLSTEGLFLNDEKVTQLTDDQLAKLLSLSQISVGSQEGTTRSNALYKYVKTDYVNPRIVVGSNFSGNGQSFYLPSETEKSNAIDFTKQYILAKLDLSSCQLAEENVFSVGESISVWGTSEKKANLHVYYKKAEKKLYLDLVDPSCPTSLKNQNTYCQATEVLKDEELSLVTIKLSKDGVRVNDRAYVLKEAVNNKLTSLSTVEIGSQDAKASHATYQNVIIVTPVKETEVPSVDERLIALPWKNLSGEGKEFYSTTDIDFDKQSIEATIDLSTCETNVVSNKSFETLLSVGNDISSWDGTGVYNLHIYYSKKEQKLEADFLNSSTGNKNQTTETISNLEPGILKVKLAKEGLYFNGKLAEKITAALLENLLNLKEVQIGSLQGDIRSHATYKSLDIKNLDFNVSWISDPSKFEDNKEEAHATYIPYATTSEMKADAEFYNTPWVASKSVLVKNLNTVEGDEWKFCYVKGTTSGPGGSEFYAKDFETSSEYVAADWKSIRVPLSWEMAGYGRPVYTNIGYPFKVNAPKAMESNAQTNETDHNATGFYRRCFTIDDTWKDKRIFLHFDGVYSAAVVWVDGKYVGYTQGSNNDAEFDITAALDKASDGSSILTGEGSDNEHQLSVRVYRWCDGSYLEGQDAWHLSGIHRDVYLVAKPKVFVSDAVITSDLSDDATSGKLNVALTIDNRDLVENVKKIITVTLTDKDGKQVAEPKTITYDSSTAGSTDASTTSGSTTAEKTTINVEFTGLSGLTPWTAETPYLYNIGVSQTEVSSSADASSSARTAGNVGNEEMAFNTKYGFRKISFDTKLVKINGKRVFFKGVNTQDTHPEFGRAIDVETMMKDLTMMKRANINTVRTSHYPRQAKMYAMMDALGFYVMDEADVECHRYWINQSDHLTSNETWSAQYVDRNERMVKRDRNHPSVIFWSLGNESGDGVCMTNAYKAVKALDNERPVHYESTFNKGYSNGSGTNTNQNSDLFSDMYPTVSNVEAKKSGSNTYNKPYFICEYAHAMGQGVGNLKDYWDAIESSSAIIGGCIWDWVDQAIYKTSSDGVDTSKGNNGFHNWTSGYDYNQVDKGAGFEGNFLDNGLVTPDRRWSGKLTEVKKVYQNVDFTSLDAANKTLTLQNKFAFTDLSSDQFDIAYKVLKDGRLVEEGTTAHFSAIKASETGSLTIPYQTVVSDDAEYLINVELRNKEQTDWADAGYIIADAQFPLSTQDVSNGKEIGTDAPMGLPKLEDYTVETASQASESDSSESQAGTLALSLDATNRSISGTDKNGKTFALAFDENGKMTKWTYDGKSLLHTDANGTLAANAAPDFNSMRNIDNDASSSITQVNQSTSTEIISGKDLTLSDDKLSATLSVTGTATNCTYQIDYTIYADATVDMKVTFTPSSDTRRLGLGMQFAAGFENVEYYARGPWSNYTDRKTGSYLGRYTTTVDDMVEEEVHPQTYGDHQDLRELILSNATSRLRIGIKVGGLASFSLSHYDETVWCGTSGTGQKTLWNDDTHTHWYNLTKQKQVFAHFDYWQRGLGNNSCGGDTCLNAYKCPTSGSHTYTLRFQPF